MTTENYILFITDNKLSLIDDSAVLADEEDLSANEYFALMICADYQSFVRNYKEYEGNVNYNITHAVYDIGIEKDSFNDGWYISKTFKYRSNLNRGRTIIVNIPDTSCCTILT